MSEDCSRCRMLAAMAKMSNLEKANVENKKEVISSFINNEISFKETGIQLGLTEKDIVQCIEKEYQDKHING